MNISNLCRVCLSSENKMHIFNNTLLQNIYEKLAETKLSANIPTMLCYICTSQLRGCAMFATSARRSESLLKQLCSGTDLIQNILRQQKYTISPIEYVNIIDVQHDNNDVSDTTERDSKGNINIKVEPELDSYIDNTPSSDSEDDVPLNSLKTEPKMVKQKRKYEKRKKIDSHEVYLTKEQQIQAMQSRAKSLNYLNSPYKCDLCYKGFINDVAYGNHMEKHQERSGTFSCSICHVRYLTSRLLRAHAHAAHERIFRCNKCNHLCHTAHQASDHDRWHEGHTYECQLCGQSFEKRTTYLTHKRLRHPSEHICHICGDRFVSRHGLNVHRNKAHSRHEIKEDTANPSERFCSECDIQFVTLDAWKRHILTSIKHTLKSEDSKHCPICSKQIPEGASIAGHFKEHEKTMRRKQSVNSDSVRARIPCEQCGTSYSNKSKLQAHIKRIHLGLKYNKNIVCEVCGKKCTSNASLKYHQRVHTGERPHACITCNKRFSNTNQLRIHTRTHSGERPYACEHCALTFTQKPALTRHHRVHTGDKPYVCQFCSKSFSQSNSLKIHVRAVHEKIPYRRQKIDEKTVQV